MFTLEIALYNCIIIHYFMFTRRYLGSQNKDRFALER